MTLRSPLASLPALGLLAASFLALIGPALAGPADVALLKSYVGNYAGKGVMTGTSAQPVSCRLMLRPGEGDKVNYSGRCEVAGASFSLSGIMAYVAAKNHFEAAMTSSGGSGVAIGQKRDGGVVFTSKQVMTTQGHTGTVTSTLALAGGTLRVDFSMLEDKTGTTTTGTIPFTKS